MLSKKMLLYFILFPLVSFSQSETPKDSSGEQYNNAIQFYIINQVIAAYKYNFSENSAFRFRINATGLFNDKKSEDIYPRSTDHFIKTRNWHSDHFFEINIHYLYQVKLQSIIHAYFGGGPFANYQIDINQYQQDEYNNENILTNHFYENVKEESWSVGISVLAGLEFIVYKNISMFAEYEGTFSKGWWDRTTSSIPSDYNSLKEKYNIWNYELKGIRIGAGIYF